MPAAAADAKFAANAVRQFTRYARPPGPPGKLLFLRHHAALGVHGHPIDVLVLTGGDIVVVGQLFRADDLAAGQSEQGDRRGKVLGEHVRGKRRPGWQRCHQDCHYPAPHVFAHGVSSYYRFLNLSGSASMAQIASRESATALASDGSPSCKAASTLSINDSYGWRSCASVVLARPS